MIFFCSHKTKVESDAQKILKSSGSEWIEWVASMDSIPFTGQRSRCIAEPFIH